MATPAKPLALTFPRDMKLRGRIRFDTVFKTGARRIAHPLAVHVLRREDNTPSRLGISIGVRCGHAVQRNLIKRRLREAFRLMQHNLAPGMDFLVVVKPHAPLPMSAYQARFRQLLT
jgi:ribonuclease P protein component